MKQLQHQYIIFGIIIFLLIVVGLFFYMKVKPSGQSAEKKDSVFEEPTEVIPTVDSSVKASIEGSTEATISLSGIPAGTKEIEYELSYETKSGSIEGVFGKIEVNGSSQAEEEVTFGTCSSGVCRYHEIDGPINGVFKFSGSYGERLLETSFDL